MKQLNYQHLFYFWNVVKEESVTRAGEKLHLAQPTISGQLAVFEQAIGTKLYYRRGRKLELTETGRIVFHYADEIFSLGRELTNALKGHTDGRGSRLTVGIADALPKLAVYRLLEPAFHLPEPVQLICYEDKAERLLNEITLQNIDLVFSDTPLTPGGDNKAFNHFLGACGISVFGSAELVQRYRSHFPQSLNGAPFLLPTINTALRRSLDYWFDIQSISPKILAEIEDSALIKTFGSSGIGLFVAPQTFAREIRHQYGVEIVGHIDDVQERFYSITLRRKLKDPAVTAILENACEKMFIGNL